MSQSKIFNHASQESKEKSFFKASPYSYRMSTPSQTRNAVE